MSATLTEGIIESALKKPSKTLAVGIEYTPISELSSGDLQTLSMQMRKIKASAIWTDDLNAAKEFVIEQDSAKGNFPGPCPIIYNGNDVPGAIDIGVTAVVNSPSDDVAPSEPGVEIIWNIQSPDEVDAVKDKGGAYLFDADNEQSLLDAILEAIPTGSVIIASLDSMQDENAELERGKELKAKGVTSILIKNGCVGDNEDVEYSTFVISGLTRKQSSTFNMSGLTGSTNGHFGGVAGSQATTWLRKKRQDQ